MDRRFFYKIHNPRLIATVLFSILILLSTGAVAQRKSKAAKNQAEILNLTGGEPAKINIQAAQAPGVGEVALENYTGSPLKALQFRVIATSMNKLKSVLPGSSISDKKLWSFHHFIVPGNPDDTGKRADTIKVVIFCNGWSTFPSGTSIKLLTLNYYQPMVAGTPADTVNFKITDIVGALERGEAAIIESETDASLNLWK